MEEKIKISVTVATYNRGKQLSRTLDSIARQSLDITLWEAVIVDNNSTDDTAEIFRIFAEENSQAVNFRMVFEGQQGLSHARNRGIAESRGEYIVLIDDDEEASTDFLRNYLDFFESHPDAAAAGGKIAPVYETDPPEWLSPYLERPLAAKIDMGPEVKLFRGANYPVGGNMAFRRGVFEKYGVFNTGLGRTGKKLLGGEEKDIFGRLRDAGENIYWVPGPCVRHIISGDRLTRGYLIRLSRMIGLSERMRTLGRSRASYMRRLGSEFIKWCGTIIISIGYILRLQPSKAGYLYIMRYNMTRGLFVGRAS